MRAYRQVISNKGSAGVDGRSINDLYKHLIKNRERIESELRLGKYLPQAILGVEIPKSNGKTRLLGIPTVTDRLLQQAVGQVIAIKFEMDFEDYSYGFRPNRNAQQAVLKAQEYINSGYNHIVDIDLKSFFDEVDHCILLQLLYRKVKCPLTLRLIRKWLRAPILINGKLVKRRKGVPQGSPLSPLLSNIMLNELDKEMEKQGLRYVRYADDFSIYTKSNYAARKTGNNIYLFLKEQVETTHQPGEKWHTQTCKLYAAGIWICTHIRKGRERQIPVGSKRQKLEIAQAETQNHHSQDYSMHFR